MKVYQLRLKDLDLLLEPVFKDEMSANLFKSKYNSRNIDLEENVLDKDYDFVYRIKRVDVDGYELLDNLFTDIDELLEYVKKCALDNYSVVKESIINTTNFDYSLVEV